MEISILNLISSFTKRPRIRILILELHHEGKILKLPQDIQLAISDYYHSLYSKDEAVDMNTQARRMCLATVPKIMTTEQNTLLIQPFLVEDLHNALKDLPTCKVPGLDGTPTEFLKELWNDIKDNLVTYSNAILAKGSLGTSISLSNLSIIPKKGTLALISNRRSLSILNTIYKLIAKAIANRSRTLMPLWIRPSQTGFVKGRHILENIFTTQEAMYWANNSRQNLTIILLEFEKAFDRVNWVFLECTLLHLGVSPL